jgi:hypothetical protein
MKLLNRPVLLFAAGLGLVALGIALYLVSDVAGAAVALLGLGVICGSPFARVLQARRHGAALPYAGAEPWVPGAELGPAHHHHHGGDAGGGDGGGFFDFGGFGGGGDGGGGG